MLDSLDIGVPEFSLFEEYKLITAHDMLHLLVQEFYKLAVGRCTKELLVEKMRELHKSTQNQ